LVRVEDVIGILGAARLRYGDAIGSDAGSCGDGYVFIVSSSWIGRIRP
jgi:hypothetical protein